MIYNPNRIVITGLGVLAPNGTGLEEYWRTLLACESGIAPITLFDTTGMPSKIAGEVKDFDPRKYLDSQIKPKRLARHTQLALAATYMALEDSGIDFNDQGSVPVVLGVSYSALDVLQQQMFRMFQYGAERVSPHVVEASTPQSVAGCVSRAFGVHAEGITISTACVAGLDAIAKASELIHSGKVDIAIAGGADAPITPFAFASFAAGGLTSTLDKHPEKVSRPFDRNRDTGIISEGAGVVILENLSHALARGAVPYAEITGYGTNVDPDPNLPASGLAITMEIALANASKTTFDIDYICAHGPSHPILDRVETQMIKQVFGQRAYSIPTSSIKGATGNPLAAAGPIQVITCAMALCHGLIPPTTNFEEGDAYCDLDYVSGGPRSADLNTVLVNAHGVGGGNSSLVLERLNDR